MPVCTTPAPAIAPRGVCRARRPRESPLWRILSDHFVAFAAVYDERYRPAWGYRRRVVDRAVGLVPHRQIVVTLPKLLRPFFKFDRALLTDLALDLGRATPRAVL